MMQGRLDDAEVILREIESHAKPAALVLPLNKIRLRVRTEAVGLFSLFSLFSLLRTCSRPTRARRRSAWC